MDLRRLEYFVVVAEEGNVGRAAQRLHMTQSPLSRRIRELEVEVGRTLFDRTTTGMRLTDAGRLLLEDARPLLRAASQTVARVRRDASDMLRVGALGPAESGFSQRAATAFRLAFPNVDVQLSEGGFGDPTVGLGSGSVDAALTVGPFGLRGLATRILRTDSLVAAIPADDSLARRPLVTRRELASRRSVRFPSSADRMWREFWQVGGGSDGPVVQSVDECLHAVVWQGAVALTPRGVAAAHPTDGIRFVPLDGVERADLVLARRAGGRNPVLDAYASALLSDVEHSAKLT
jgi:DNA-binding transcriptional LysR family regulator